MPIEDVDYLKQHSEKETYVFLVDSAERDRDVYPTPSSYVITFTSPFVNVIGLEVVDASIPRTQYNIDLYNNTIRFLIHDKSLNGSQLDQSMFYSATIDPGDYSIQTLLPKLNEALSNVSVFGSTTPIQASITVESYSSPPEITNLVRFRCSYPFVFDMTNSTIAETLGFHMYTQETEAQKSILEQRYTIPRSVQVNRQLYHSVDIDDPNIAVGPSTTLFEGPRGIIDRLPFSTPQTKIAQSFVVSNVTYLTEVWAALAGTGSVAWEIYTDRTGGGAPSVPVPNARGTINISESDGTLSQATNVRRVKLDVGTYWIQFTATPSAVNASILYNDVVGETNRMKVYNNDNVGWSIVTIGDAPATASIRIASSPEYHELVSPGTYNLIGERYIILRCPEIEENSYRSLAYSKFFLGLAMFRLGTVGLSDNQVKHIDIPTRQFHPIGKLSRLSFRFETIHGQPYDFKGVNHTVTLALHYLSPRNKGNFERSIINPNYTGNFLEYMYTQKEQEEDSDDQEEDFNRDILANYKIQEARHMPDAIRRLDREALFRASITEDTSSNT